MAESSLLETTAEVAVAFAGFIGIFLVLATRDGRFPEGDALAIRVIVAASVGPVFYSALPLLLHALGSSGPSLWRISSSAVLLISASGTAYIVRLRNSVPKEERFSPHSLQNIASWSFTALVLLCHLENALGWPWAPSGGVYLLGIWAALAIAGTSFIDLIYRRVL